MTRPTLAGLIEISKWWRTRGGEAIVVELTPWAGRTLIHVRTWHSEAGRLKPGKGFCCEAKHLPRLASALAKACSRARDPGLIASDDDSFGTLRCLVGAALDLCYVARVW
jgi:hypothetical protein